MKVRNAFVDPIDQFVRGSIEEGHTWFRVTQSNGNPYLYCGDWVLVRLLQDGELLVDGCLYLLQIDNCHTLRRVQRLPGPRLRFFIGEQGFEDFTAAPHEIASLGVVVVGRAVAIMRRP